MTVNYYTITLYTTPRFPRYSPPDVCVRKYCSAVPSESGCNKKNLRSCIDHAPTPVPLQIGVFNTDDLRAVFALAGSVEEKCARDAAITLGNLAVVTRNQVNITDAGGLLPLVTMIGRNAYLSCQKFAGRALYRLAAHGDNKPRVVAEGALPPLVRRLRSPDAEVARCVGDGVGGGFCVILLNLLRVVWRVQELQFHASGRPLCWEQGMIFSWRFRTGVPLDEAIAETSLFVHFSSTQYASSGSHSNDMLRTAWLLGDIFDVG